jgi:glyoxylase-like metal-dependent hydrolase (beta-lactamase superfamily II)
MRQLMILFAAAAAALAPGCGSQPQAPVEEARAKHDGRLMPPEKVADHVWYMRQPPRVWSAVIGNVGVIEQGDGVVLVDSGGSIPDGRDIVDEVAKLTPKPVKAVVITHWHNDHPLGVPGILEKFPKARVIATAGTARMMGEIMGKNTGVGRNDPALDKGRAQAGETRAREYEAQANDPARSAGERQEYAIEARWVRARLKRQMGNYVALPTETFTDRLLIGDPVAPVELRFLGAANTGGDLIAWLPKQRVVLTGDAVVAPSPYGFNVRVKSWRSVLDKLKTLNFATLVPGHGAAQHDRAYVDTMIWSMADLERQVRAAVAKGLSEEKAIQSIDSTAHAARFKADTPWSKTWLDGYWIEPAAASIYREIKEGRVVEGR